eukprot:gnl/TRDRNA2_/TRDRNA2_135791_c0_seq1.p1 gnl/TRDRNA2_/TRDRNA2_135791_c0~~gnl/TRDRNA2_/TRDRNA2_135791_c0_seq1.p1  ORF type:complete len:227 (-),score=38.54 gnl/TRDRNA2_/TRDRNA2_135791_c0_seq1:58-738(-)
MAPMLETMPDEVLEGILAAYPHRTDVRAVASRWREVIQERFPIRHCKPPEGGVFFVDFEVDTNMSKHLYCAQFGGSNAGEEGGVSGAVTFVNWLPNYYRSVQCAKKDIRYRIVENDAQELWRLIAKMKTDRESESPATSEVDDDALDEQPATRTRSRAMTWPMDTLTAREVSGFITVTEGPSWDSRQVLGRLSVSETDRVLQVLDYRRNPEATMEKSANNNRWPLV